jgi:hypothetical protein
VVFVGQKRAMNECIGRAGWRMDIGGDCTVERLPKAVRSLDFRSHSRLRGKPKMIAVGRAVCYAPQQFRRPS